MKKSTPFIIALEGLCIALATGGCGEPASSNIPQLANFLRQARPPVTGAEYRVLPPDVLMVRSTHIPEINNMSEIVRPDGKINLPLVGEIYVAQKTPKEIEQAIQEAAKTYYKKVDATVQVTGYNSQKIYVYGQVFKPGPIAWTGTDTVLDVLSKTQPTPQAEPKKVRILRQHRPTRGGYLPTTRQATTCQTKAGADVITIDLMAMVEHGDLSRNILLEPDDMVYVPPSIIGYIGLEMQKMFFPVQPILEATRVPVSVTSAIP